MKRLKKLALSILGVTVLSLGLYACSNDDSVNEEKKSLAKETNKEDLIKELANDSDFVDFVNQTNEIMLKVDSNKILKFVNIDRKLTSVEEYEFVEAFGYEKPEEFKSVYDQSLKKLETVNTKYKLESFEKNDLNYIFIESINLIDNMIELLIKLSKDYPKNIQVKEGV